ncbi:MAG: hypothetical protein JWO71_3800 [Candidatus Acidoferrum typicum]|nr:hypothetical protein [Candidatus Acidoferrum typicum]
MAQLQNSTLTAVDDCASPPSGLAGALHGLISFCLEGGIHLWVQLTGKLVRKGDAPWLAGPLGGRERIGTGIYERVARAEGLLIRTPPHAGLLENFNLLRGPNFNPDGVHPDIRHFYEHAAEYQLDVWSEVSLTGRFFLWLLVEFISRRMDQLNFPISSLEVAKGMTSEVVQLVEPISDRIVNTGWLRRLKSSGRVIYAGLYSATQLPDETGPCVKVTFPCRGSANVYLNPVAHEDGSFGLVSSGSAFGRTGFYRMIDGGPDHYIVRHVRSLRELFHVYVDAEGVLRTDHSVFFLGLAIIRLHYKMTLVSVPQWSTQDERELIAVDDIL